MSSFRVAALPTSLTLTNALNNQMFQKGLVRPCEYGLLPENTPKNKYPYIIPCGYDYDFSSTCSYERILIIKSLFRFDENINIVRL